IRTRAWLRGMECPSYQGWRTRAWRGAEASETERNWMRISQQEGPAHVGVGDAKHHCSTRARKGHSKRDERPFAYMLISVAGLALGGFVSFGGGHVRCGVLLRPRVTLERSSRPCAIA